MSSRHSRAKLSSLRSHLPSQEEGARILPTLQKMKLKGQSTSPFPFKKVCPLFVSVNTRFREICWRVLFLPPERPLFLSGMQRKGKYSKGYGTRLTPN